MAASSVSHIVNREHKTITYLSSLQQLMMSHYKVDEYGVVDEDENNEFVCLDTSDELYTFLMNVCDKMRKSGSVFIENLPDNARTGEEQAPLPKPEDIVKPEEIEVENIGVF